MKHLLIIALLISSCGSSDESGAPAPVVTPIAAANDSKPVVAPTAVAMTKPSPTPTQVVIVDSKPLSADEMAKVLTIRALRNGPTHVISFRTYLKRDAGVWKDVKNSCPGLMEPLDALTLGQATVAPLIAALPTSESIVWGYPATSAADSSIRAIPLVDWTNTHTNGLHYSAWDSLALIEADARGQVYCQIMTSFIPKESELSAEGKALLAVLN